MPTAKKPTSKKSPSKKSTSKPTAKVKATKSKVTKTNSKAKIGTVAWLIDQLSKLPGNMPVAGGDHDGYYYDCDVVEIRRLFEGQEVDEYFEGDAKKAIDVVCLSSW
jgi:hypothetical protein